MLTQDELLRESSAAGFQAEPFEKVLQLIELLEALRSHPFLAERLVLKGGTALNLFELELPRLSVDIDLNYVGSVDVGGMREERPRVEQAIEAVCARMGIQVKRIPQDHAGGKWRLSYRRAAGMSGTIELDLNFLLRQPLWPTRVVDSVLVGSHRARSIPILDVHELAAGKLAALLARTTGRDLFDTRGLMSKVSFDDQRLRIGFVVYGAMNRKDWREVSINDVGADPVEVERNLIPMLLTHARPERSELEIWTTTLVDECRAALARVLPMTGPELEFLDKLNGRGHIVPQLLTSDSSLQERIAHHPGLLWKAQNVRLL